MFHHELAHVTQNHDKIRNGDSNLSILEVSDNIYEQLCGDAAWVSHVTELAADYEAIRHCIRFIVATSIDESNNIRPEVTNWCEIWSLACGVMCLFFRFYGQNRPPVKSEASGTHPDPIFRARLMIKVIFGLVDGLYCQYFPWNTKKNSDGFGLNLAHLLEHAVITAGMYWSDNYLRDNELPKLFCNISRTDEAFIDYEKKVVETWKKLLPRIKANYYGGALDGLMNIEI